MSAQPIERPPTHLRLVGDNRHAVRSMLDYLALPAPTIVPRADAVHIAVADVDDLAAWLYALGGTVHRGPEQDGAALWTLHTQTPRRADGSSVAVRVHVPVVAGEDVLAGVRLAVAR
ncbi:hypothetical protein ACMA1D_02185 [Streptomyces sp. 796.1]|uniref:hypothetical protein n=1 Tax=Streptomyces sp. 796.1 TaxID=3163029 RepID=UPI0039C99D5B